MNLEHGHELIFLPIHANGVMACLFKLAAREQGACLCISLPMHACAPAPVSNVHLLSMRVLVDFRGI